jgi:hypothetical protein
MSAYCSTSDVYRWIPPGSVSNPARLVSAVSTSADTLTIDGHGLALNSTLQVRAESGGTLPSPLAEGTVYYAKPVTDSAVQLASTAGGTAINLTTTGANVVVIVDLPWATWIEEASAEIDCTMPAHVVPLATVPAIVRAYTSALVAERALTFCGVTTDALKERMVSLRLELKEWRRGVPIRGTNAPTQGGSLCVVASSLQADARGWNNASGGKYLP